MTQYLMQYGIKAAVVTGETPNQERDKILADFESGKIHALCNVGVLTEGWDAPRTDCIALLRPTQSIGLYVQMCGRGMRIHDDKSNCLLLDYGENVARHGCLDEVTPEENVQVDTIPRFVLLVMLLTLPLLKNALSVVKSLSLSKLNHCGLEKSERLLRRTKAERQAVLSDERAKA